MINKNIDKLKEFCCEDISLIENYDIAISSNDKYHCHHRLEIQDNCIVSREFLIENNLYYHRPANELIFLTEKEHKRLHSNNMSMEWHKRISESLIGHSVDNETRFKISESNKGKSRNKEIVRSNETRQKISATKTGVSLNLTDEERKRRSDFFKENNPSKSRDMKGKNNPRFGIKVPEEQKKRQSEKMKGRHWYNNGEITISAFDCPDGFVKGRLNGGRK